MINNDAPVSQAEFQANINKSIGIDVVQGENPGQRLLDTIEERSKPTSEYLKDIWDVTKANSPTHSIINAADIIINSKTEPGFDPKTRPELYKDINPEDHHAIDAALSYDMGVRLHDQIAEKYRAATLINNLGPGGVVPTVLSMLDPVNVGSMFFAPEMALANKIRGTGRAVSTARGLVGGTVAEAGIQTGLTLIEPTGHWTDIIDAAVAGGALGGTVGVLGAFKNDPALKHLDASRDKFVKHVHNNAESAEANAKVVVNENPYRAPQEPVMDPEGSIGAGYIPAAGEAFNPDGVSAQTLKMRMKSRTALAEFGVGQMAADAFGNAAWKAGDKFQAVYDNMMKTPLAPMYDLMMNSGSHIAQELAFRLGEHSAGIYRNNTSGIMLREVYRTMGYQGISDAVNGYDAAFFKWLKDNGKIQGKEGWTAEAIAQWAALDPTNRAAFNREIALQRNQVHIGKMPGYDSNGGKSYLKSLNEHLDKDTNQWRKSMQSEDGKSPVRGSEGLTEADSRGYLPQHVNGKAIQTAIQTGQTTEKAIINMFKSAYKIYNLSDKLVTMLAKAQVRRATSISEGIDSNMFRMLNQNGELYLSKYLTDSLGISQSQTEKIIAGLKVSTPEADKVGFLRSKRELDWSTPLEGTNLQLVDFMHHDIPAIWNHASTRTSGMAALARHGYQYGDMENIVNSIMEEAQAAGNTRLQKEDLLNFIQPFMGGPIYGAPPKWVRQALSAVSLSIYGGIGLAQATETAAGAAAFGLREFTHAMKVELGKAPSATVRQVEHLVAGVNGEERVFMEKYQMDQFSQDAPSMHELNTWIDRGLASGRYIQGIVTGFYKVKMDQQRATLRCMMNALDDSYTGVKTMDPARLRDIGMDPKTEELIKKYFVGPNAVVTRTVDEAGERQIYLHLDEWARADEVAFGAVLNRAVNQVVQKAMLGESTPWMHKTVGAIMLQGKVFSMTSLTKQWFRNAQLGTDPMQAALINGMIMGTAGYIASRTLAMDDKGLDPISIIKGGISNSNMTSWVPAFWDTGAALTGIDSLKLSPYSFSPRTDLIGIPPAITSVNSMLHLPFVPLHVVTGTFSNNDVMALKATPIIGNHILFKGLWNQLKD